MEAAKAQTIQAGEEKAEILQQNSPPFLLNYPPRVALINQCGDFKIEVADMDDNSTLSF